MLPDPGRSIGSGMSGNVGQGTVFERPTDPVSATDPLSSSSAAPDHGLRAGLAKRSVRLSYAATIEHKLMRRLCLALEAATGRPKLERLYERYCAEPHGEDFFIEAIERMGVEFRLRGEGCIPATGSLAVVANHPFGAMDGIAVGCLLGRVRPDVMIIAHSALARVPELAERLFPIDFSGTREAERANIKSRSAALAHLKSGGCLVVFPAGAVMTTPRPLARTAEELPWGPLSARLIMRSGATVLPLYVGGQNSRLFQLASHVSQSLRYALLFHEAARMIGGTIDMTLGRPIPFETVATFQDAVSLTAWLRRQVFSLADSEAGWNPQDAGFFGDWLEDDRGDERDGFSPIATLG